MLVMKGHLTFPTRQAVTKGEDMCGRYASARQRIELLEEFGVQRDRVTEPLAPDYNVAPTKAVYAVLTRAGRDDDPRDDSAHDDHADNRSADDRSADDRRADNRRADDRRADDRRADDSRADDSRADDSRADDSRAAESGHSDPEVTPRVARELRVVRWGLVPSWAKDVSIGSRLINARAETLSEKPAYRRAFARRRCLLPADGYYEWQVLPPAPGTEGATGKAPKKVKQPFFIHRADGGPLAFAGLYELWRDRAVPDGEPASWLWSATIVTTSAPDELGQIHDRMPMVIAPDSWADWLDPANTDTSDLQGLLVPAVSDGLESYPVSTAVNSVRHNGPDLLDRVPVPDELSLTPEPPPGGADRRRLPAGITGQPPAGQPPAGRHRPGDAGTTLF
jgi:putative SOS response-associated peptidase YedK